MRRGGPQTERYSQGVPKMNASSKPTLLSYCIRSSEYETSSTNQGAGSKIHLWEGLTERNCSPGFLASWRDLWASAWSQITVTPVSFFLFYSLTLWPSCLPFIGILIITRSSQGSNSIISTKNLWPWQVHLSRHYSGHSQGHGSGVYFWEKNLRGVGIVFWISPTTMRSPCFSSFSYGLFMWMGS